MNALYVVVGTVVSGWVLTEMLTTILHPDWRAPLTARVERGIWGAVRMLRRLVGERALLLGGPLAVVGAVGLWIAALWLGFALIWLGLAESLSIAAEDAFDGQLSLLDALYFSGSTMTTVGFGDLIASTPATRLVAVIEAGAGFMVLTSSITYVLSVYPLVSGKRSLASQAHDLGLGGYEGASSYALEASSSDLQTGTPPFRTSPTIWSGFRCSITSTHRERATS